MSDFIVDSGKSRAGSCWHALGAEEAVQVLGSDAEKGLGSGQAEQRLRQFGANALPESKQRSLVSVFFGQFKSPLIYLLLAAALIALVLGHVSDAVVIAVVVILNAVIGALQEGRAERSLAALRKLAEHKVRLRRDGGEQIASVKEVVPGDIVVLEAGDAVPADARLLHAATLQVAEAALTGESIPVAKSIGPLKPDTSLADRQNMVYAGTYVTAGRAHAVVTATGLSTEIGRIAQLAQSTEETKTPLEIRIAGFGRIIIVLAVVSFLIVNAIGLMREIPFGEIVMIAISQVVGMIPEGLPVAMTIALAVGVQRMARRRAVVRRLSAVETLGSTTVICTDKTGTLTRNEMTVTDLHLLHGEEGREIQVSGIGYRPEGVFTLAGQPFDPQLDKSLQALLEAVVLCNDAQLREVSQAGKSWWQPIGDPTEVALLVLGMKGGLSPDELRARMPRRAEIPFDSSTKMMATQHDTPTGSQVILKGAPEVLLQYARSGPDGEGARRLLQAAAEKLAREALRVLAVGVVDQAEIVGDAGFEAFVGRVTLLGVVGQLDPPRSEAKDAVLRCISAGIRPVMVTGDHKVTAERIAQDLGIAQDGTRAIDGAELDRLTDQDLERCVDQVSVFARVHPAQKLRIIAAYQRRKEVVAMTGDGVNDAPALVKADVGVAMGIAGTDVAKESAKIVLEDDNFATIIAAVEEGRVVYRNIKKAVLLLFSTSAAEVLVLLLAMLLGYPPPFLAVQILWNNLITEGLITVNLVMEPAEGDEMRQSPISANEPLLTRKMLGRLALMATSIVAVTLGWFIFRTQAGVPEAQVRTEAFTLLAICEWYNVLNCRSESKSAFSLNVLRNPWLLGGLAAGNLLQIAVVFWTPLASVFHTVPFDLHIVILLGLVGSLVLWVEELRKLISRILIR